MITKRLFLLTVFLVLTASFSYGQDTQTSIGKAPANQVREKTDTNILKNNTSQGFLYTGSSLFQLNSQFMSNMDLSPVGEPVAFGLPAAMAWVPNTKQLYVIDQLPPFGLYTVNTLTGALTLVVNCSGVPFSAITGITWDGTAMWGVATESSYSQIFTINITSGECSFVGSYNTICQVPVTLSAAPGGSLFSVDIYSDNLFRWDKTTGIPTLIGPLGIDANYAQDACFDLSDGTYYWAAYSNGPELRIIDTLTGGSTLVGSYPEQAFTLAITGPCPVVNTDVTQAGNILTANATGASYQWVDCNNGNSIIEGENKQSFTATSSGSYAVIVTDNCTDTSLCYEVVMVGVPEYRSGNEVMVYPNPANDYITIYTPAMATIEIINSSGQIIRKIQNVGTKMVINLENLSCGVYIVKTKTENSIAITRIIKQ